MRKVLFLLIVLLAMSFSLNSQTIIGIVQDGSNGQTLPGATIYLKGTNIGTISDINGNFKLKAKSGLYKLVVSSVGYKTFEKEVNFEEGQEIEDRKSVV